MGYIYLCTAISFEVLATICLKTSNNFSYTVPAVIAISSYIISIYFVMLAMQSISVAICYSLWSGVGISLVTIIAAYKFDEVPDITAILGLGLIIAGVFLLTNLSSMGQKI